ncbi:hypothetical protein ACFQAT_26100 [Undibacterium arcticum]|uniref:Uncharacterized protein n=1 Tax=Undibacterium arcticum TaxID=1762892 RepID=A0ABV7F9E7_9BURK
MAKLFNRLVQLQGKAHVCDISRINGTPTQCTQVWALDDGSSIVMQMTPRIVRGESSPVCETIEKTNRPFKVVVATVKRKYTLLRKKQEVQKCI